TTPDNPATTLDPAAATPTSTSIDLEALEINFIYRMVPLLPNSKSYQPYKRNTYGWKLPHQSKRQRNKSYMK
ncbi:hypothetical protein C0989_005088, partial [Termitomyces sp. Mn162]